jgi:hypothetical protein
MEQIMNNQSPSSPSSNETETWKETPPNRRALMLVAAAVAIVAAIGVAIVVDGDNDDPTETVDPTVTAEPADREDPPLVLNLGAFDAAASCLRPDAATLAAMSPAFRGTASSIDGDTITLTVDEWYAGGDEIAVELHLQPGMEALIAGFTVELDEQYLIAANNGSVNLCGFSGPLTPEIEAMYAEAFPA